MAVSAITRCFSGYMRRCVSLLAVWITVSLEVSGADSVHTSTDLVERPASEKRCDVTLCRKAPLLVAPECAERCDADLIKSDLRKRSVADGVISKEQCDAILQLASFAMDKYDWQFMHSPAEKYLSLPPSELARWALRQPEDIRVSAACMVRNFVRSMRLLHDATERELTKMDPAASSLSLDLGLLSCSEKAVPDTENQPDSRAAHADICYPFGEYWCDNASTPHSWRSHSAVLFFSGEEDDGFEGGDFFYAMGWDGKHRTRVRPTCGRAVFFSSGQENINGVEAVRRGRRCSLPMWLTSDQTKAAMGSELALAEELLAQSGMPEECDADLATHARQLHQRGKQSNAAQAAQAGGASSAIQEQQAEADRSPDPADCPAGTVKGPLGGTYMQHTDAKLHEGHNQYFRSAGRAFKIFWQAAGWWCIEYEERAGRTTCQAFRKDHGEADYELVPPRDRWRVWEGTQFMEQPNILIELRVKDDELYLQDCRGLGISGSWLNPAVFTEESIASYRKQWDDVGIVRFEEILQPRAAEYFFNFMWDVKDAFWKMTSNKVGTQDPFDEWGKARTETATLKAQRQRARAEAAAGNFNFMFHWVKQEDSLVAGEFKDHVLSESGGFFDLMGQITQRPLILHSDRVVQFFPGDFLSKHSDNVGNRSMAYVFQFSKDWRPEYGGNLVFMDNGNNVDNVYVPKFNDLIVFDVVQRNPHHAVADVVDASLPAKRLCVSGWLGPKS